MDFAEQLRVLQAAQGDPARLALATVDLAYPELGEADRTTLKQTLSAVAIPHWCDEEILSVLMTISKLEAQKRLARLRGLSVIEPFPARGADAVNVHEAARLAMRRRLATEHESEYHLLSGKSAEYFARMAAPADRIEWLYHLFGADPDLAAHECEELDRSWSNAAYPEDRDALALALGELEACRLINGRARVEIMLCCAEVRSARGATAQLEAVANDAVILARETQHLSGEVRALCLKGDVLQEQGKLREAEKAFGEALRISRKLAEQDPINAGWQRDLAVAHSKVGDVLQAQGKLGEAEKAFGEGLRISRKLAEQDPMNAGWQRELAVAHGRVGDVLQAQGKLGEAEKAFGEDLRIIRKLAEQDPMNAGWQRVLAVAHSRVGDVLQEQGKLGKAEKAFGEVLRISRKLAEQDPMNAGWQRELATAHGKVGDVLQAQEKLGKAEKAFGEDLRISRKLAEQDPMNAGWQRDLAVTALKLARLNLLRGKMAEAIRQYEDANKIYRDLIQRAPEFITWAEERRRIELELLAARIAKRRSRSNE